MTETISTTNKKIQINTHTKIKTITDSNIKIMTATNPSTIKITKRDGTQELLDINKIHFVVEEACEGLAGVSSNSFGAVTGTDSLQETTPVS